MCSLKVKSLTLQYTYLDSLTSSWREFLAVHDIENSSPLIVDILASKPVSDDIEEGNVLVAH